MKNAWFEMLDPDGFKHSGDGKIRLYKGGFLGNPGKSISKFAKDPIGSVGGLLEDTVKDVSREMGNFQSSVSHELAGLDDAVNENLPGGWLLPVIVVAAWYGVPPEVWTEMTTSLGATEAGAAVGATEAGAAVGAAEAGAAVGAGAAGGASASTAFWQATLQGLVDMGVPWELVSSLPAAASAAGTSSIISGIQAALTGQDVFKSALTGGVFAFAGGTIANSLINAGVNATIANVASQATVQALRNGKISPESLLISAGTSMMNKEVAEILKGAGVPTQLIPTALGAVNQALFTGEIDPNKLAAQAVGQFAKGSWDSIKDDLKATQPPAPVEDRVVGSQEYIDAQNEYRQGVTEYSTKAEDLNNDLKAYKDIQTQISDFNKTYQPIVDERNSLIDAHTELAKRYDNYDATVGDYNYRKSQFETPVRSDDREGGGDTQGLHVIESGDDDNPTVYGDERGAAFIRSRNGEGDTYMRRIDSAFPEEPPLSQDELYEQAKALEGKITELGTKAKDLYSTIQPTIETSRDLYKTITQKDATLKELQDNLYVPKDGNLAEKWKTEQEKYANNYNDFLKANEEKQAEDEKKALAEMERLAKEQEEKQTLAEFLKQEEEKKKVEEAKQAEEEKQRQTEQRALAEMERLKQAEKDRLAAVEEQRKQEELAEIARKNKDDEAQKEAEDKARVAKETADRLAKEKEDAKVIEDARLAKEKEEADVKTKETKPDVVDTLLGTTQPPVEPKVEEPKVEPLPTTDTPFGGNNPETSLVDILNPPATTPPTNPEEPGGGAPIKIEDGPEDIKLVPEPVVPEPPKTGDLVGGSIIAGQDELGGTVYYDFENDRYHNDEGSEVPPPPEEPSTDTITDLQKWAIENDVPMKDDGTIDWDKYDANNGVQPDEPAIEEPPKETITEPAQCGEGFHDDGTGFCVPDNPDEVVQDPTICGEGYLWDGNACVKIDDTTTGGGGSGGSGGGGGVKPPTPPVKPPVVPVKPTTPVTPTTPVAPTSGTQSSDITALISALTKTGQQQQNQPVQAPPDPYAHITQMKDIFGTDIMPASSGGSIDDLLRILRS